MIEMQGKSLSPETLMMGLGYDPALSEGAIKAPLFQVSTFVFKSPEHGKSFFEVAYGLRERREGESVGLIYSRINNPNLEILEERLAVWDHAEKALVFASGMAAIATMILAFCRPGDTIAYTMPVYGGTEYLLNRVLPRFGISAVVIALDEPALIPAQVADAARKAHASGGRLAMVFGETPANPTNELIDLRALSDAAHAIEQDEPPVVAIDNTFLGPVWQQPLDHGVDLVVYSLTKYVGGHSDLIAGGVMGSAALMGRVGELRTMLGTMLDSHTAWLLMRSLETLKIRMNESARNAAKIVDFLYGHRGVTAVLFPTKERLEPDQRAIFERQCSGPGSTLSFRVAGGEREAFDVLRELKLFKLAVSLGGTESLASHPSSMTHCDYSPEKKQRFGVTDDLIRLAVGVEDANDLIADLERALDCAFPARTD